MNHKTGTFDIPRARNQSTKGARAAYLKTYGWDWPHDDAYLHRLAQGVPLNNAPGGACDFLITRMRENDDDKEGGRAPTIQ